MLRLVMLLVIIGLSNKILACDACGCGASGNTSLGVLPLSNKNFLGLKYFYRTSQTIPESSPLDKSNEYLHTVELVGRFYPLERLQIIGFVPYQMYQQTGGHQTQINELGDASVLANYQVLGFNPISIWVHNLWLGGGIKLPTGRYDVIQNKHTVMPYLQPGSGTFDYLINTIYALKYKEWGWNTSANYKINTLNSNNQYQFGNNLNISSNIYHIWSWSNLNILPFVGINVNYDQKDTSYSVSSNDSGGRTFLLNLGIETFIYSFNIGFHFAHPLYDNHANGQIQMKNRYITTLFYNF